MVEPLHPLRDTWPDIFKNEKKILTVCKERLPNFPDGCCLLLLRETIGGEGRDRREMNIESFRFDESETTMLAARRLLLVAGCWLRGMGVCCVLLAVCGQLLATMAVIDDDCCWLLLVATDRYWLLLFAVGCCLLLVIFLLVAFCCLLLVAQRCCFVSVCNFLILICI